MRERVRVDLPAGRDHLPHHPGPRSPDGLEIPHLEVQHTRPVAGSEDRERDREVGVVAVVEGEDDRLRRQHAAPAPEVVDAPQRDGVVALLREPAHLCGEVGGPDVELRVRGIRGRVGEDVVHEDRDGRVVRAIRTLDGLRARLRLGFRNRDRRRRGRAPVVTRLLDERGSAEARPEEGPDRDDPDDVLTHRRGCRDRPAPSSPRSSSPRARPSTSRSGAEARSSPRAGGGRA